MCAALFPPATFAAPRLSGPAGVAMNQPRSRPDQNSNVRRDHDLELLVGAKRPAAVAAGQIAKRYQ
jgi:hypothetical protein